MFVMAESMLCVLGLSGFSSRLSCSKLELVSKASTDTSAIKFLLALMCASDGICSRTWGRLTNEFDEMLICSSWLHEVISFGKLEILLFDRSSSVIKVKEVGSFGGIFEITLLARQHDCRAVSRIRWKTASGICISWQSDKSSLPPFSLAA